MASSHDLNIPSPRTQTAAGRYEALAVRREPFLRRARECARLTIPSILPPEGHTGASDLPQPYQSVGADGVNNLASKLLMVLFPPDAPFFKFTLDDFVVEQLAAAGGVQEGEDPRAEFETALGKMERAIVGRMEQKGSRKINAEALEHLIVTGNGLIHVDEGGRQRFLALDKYVVSRDLAGNLLEIVVKERMAKASLPPRARELADRLTGDAATAVPAGPEEDSCDLYTWVRWDAEAKRWEVHQEISGERVPESDGTYPKGRCPWIPLRWKSVSGEAYSRGRVEEYLGDLRSLEICQMSIVDFAAVASKILIMVNESGTTQKRVIAEADSGDVVDGDARDVTFLQMDKFQDFQVVKTIGEECKARLERAFLLASAVQRQAERVTAEEIRVMINELEQGIGGVYSILSEEFQRPLVVCIWHQMEKSKDLPRLPEGTVSPQIVAGLEGLGRNSDLQRLDVFLAGVAQQFGPEVVAKYVNAGAYMRRRAAALGIDLSGLVRSEEEVQQADQQAQQMAMMQQLGPQGIKTAGDMAMQQQAAPPTAPEEA